MTDTTRKRLVWAAFIVFSVIWFTTLGMRALVPTDEGRYAEMAREMVATGDWITPRLNAIKYFEKPPLQVWATALTFEVFGLGEWQARLWTGLCGWLGILLTALAGWRLYGPRVGLTAGLVLASSFFWAALGHINTLDMGVSGMMTLALASLLIAQRDEANKKERRNWMLACWAGMALAFLSKGLMGIVLPGAVLVLYTLWSRDWKIWTRLHLVSGLALFLIISAPWIVLVSLKNPEFPHFFFIHEHFQRFTTKIHHRSGPWHYFIPILLFGILPWLGVFFQSIWTAFREREMSSFQPKKMLVTWAVFIFVFFSISDSKLPSYILPIFPALALLIALYLQRASRASWTAASVIVGVFGIAGLCLLPRLPSLGADKLEVANYHSAQPWAAAAFALMAAAALFVLLQAWRNRNNSGAASAWALAGAGFLASQLLMVGTDAQGRYRAGLDVVPQIEAAMTPDTPIYIVGMYEQSLPFYLRRTMTMVEHADEMEFGLEQEPRLWLPTRKAFIREWNNDKKAIAIVDPSVYTELIEQGLPMRLIARDARRVVVANIPHAHSE